MAVDATGVNGRVKDLPPAPAPDPLPEIPGFDDL